MNSRRKLKETRSVWVMLILVFALFTIANRDTKRKLAPVTNEAGLGIQKDSLPLPIAAPKPYLTAAQQ